jgi:DNA invertase Pin-like site-specific DNA recombinase
MRCSSIRQAGGTTFKRQKILADAFVAKHGLTLDTTFKLTDAGKSGFHGTNASLGALKRFLDEIEAGTIEKGSYLIVEKLDRLTRAKLYDALSLFKKITDAGVLIATVEPERIYDSSALEGTDALELVFSSFCPTKKVKRNRNGPRRIG